MSDNDTEHQPFGDSMPDERQAIDEARRVRNAGNDDTITVDRARNNDKTNKGPQHGSVYEEYLYGRSILSSGKHKPNWASTTKGRLAIRVVSRGVVGAAFYAWANRYVGEALNSYESNKSWSELKGPLQYVAKGFDEVLGRGIQSGARLFTSNKALIGNTVRFRKKLLFDRHQQPGALPGRSLGAEMVAVTFDFSAMSFGDGLARNVIQAFDPNLPQPWFKDKDGLATTRGQGKFDAAEWGKSLLRSSWRIVTKNAGEDWFAALPYVYQMKWQRQAIAKIPGFFEDGKIINTADEHRPFGGFKLGSDHNNNGGSLKINKDGHVTGDYQLGGVLDLQGRFVGYNVYTLIYRDLYDMIGNTIKKVRDGDLHMNFHMPKHPLVSVIDSAAISARYFAKSFIKANLFMQPSVPFFWITRVPQSKRRSNFVLEEALPGVDQHNQRNALGVTAERAQGFKDSGLRYPLRDDLAKTIGGSTGNLHFNDRYPDVPHPYSPEMQGVNGSNPFSWKSCKTITSKILNPFGWICWQAGNGLNGLASGVINNEKYNNHWVGGILGRTPGQRGDFFRNYVDASFSYTPYFMAKDEFGLRVNDAPTGGGIGKMDTAIYDLIDNVSTFRFKKALGSAQEIGHLWRHLPSDVHHAEGSIAEETEAKRLQKVAAAQSQAIKPAPVSTPTTKVQATTVQYNVAPPTHLNHTTSAEAVKAAQAPANAQKQDDDQATGKGWAESLTSRKLAAAFPPTQPTVH